MNSQKVKDKCINFMNDSEELTINFIMKHLEVEDSDSHHKSLSQMSSTTGMNFMAYDHRQNKGKRHKKHEEKEMPKHRDHKMDKESRIPQNMEINVESVENSNNKKDKGVLQLDKSARAVGRQETFIRFAGLPRGNKVARVATEMFIMCR